MPVEQDTNAIERNIREFIVSNFLFGVDDGSRKREDSFLQKESSTRQESWNSSGI